MILYLILHVLILGNVESQTANMTEDKSNKVEGNQTIIEFSTNNSTMKPDNVTSSSYKDEKSLIEKELQNNQTSTVITEDDESFQDRENKIPGRNCRKDLLVEYSHSVCGADFDAEMMSISTGNWCVLEHVINPYHKMTFCLEELSVMVDCYYPNPIIQDFFLSIHSYYFHNCSNEDYDAPQGLVMALTLIPVSIIPVLVYLVVWRSKVQD